MQWPRAIRLLQLITAAFERLEADESTEIKSEE
jgi:hypothetical protein